MRREAADRCLFYSHYMRQVEAAIEREEQRVFSEGYLPAGLPAGLGPSAADSYTEGRVYVLESKLTQFDDCTKLPWAWWSSFAHTHTQLPAMTPHHLASGTYQQALTSTKCQTKRTFMMIYPLAAMISSLLKIMKFGHTYKWWHLTLKSGSL